MPGTIMEPTCVVPIPAKPERTFYTGLCRDCVNDPTCTFPRDPSRPIWSCDEFKPSTSVSSPDQRVAPSTAGTERAEPEELKGLCRNCLRRLTCQFPKPPGGVWHCEELA
jgi:hypothetical protein